MGRLAPAVWRSAKTFVEAGARGAPFHRRRRLPWHREASLHDRGRGREHRVGIAAADLSRDDHVVRPVVVELRRAWMSTARVECPASSPSSPPTTFATSGRCRCSRTHRASARPTSPCCPPIGFATSEQQRHVQHTGQRQICHYAPLPVRSLGSSCRRSRWPIRRSRAALAVMPATPDARSRGREDR
jgi:hypothetical protein